MVRRWQVPPDESGQMSREALIGALIDASALLDIAGGTLSVVVGRQPTNLPGEMVMTGAVLEWRDRTDAKAQPEVAHQVTEPAAASIGRADDPDGAGGASEHPGAAEQPVVEPDGFDYSKLEAEDVEPEPAR